MTCNPISSLDVYFFITRWIHTRNLNIVCNQCITGAISVSQVQRWQPASRRWAPRNSSVLCTSPANCAIVYEGSFLLFKFHRRMNNFALIKDFCSLMCYWTSYWQTHMLVFSRVTCIWNDTSFTNSSITAVPHVSTGWAKLKYFYHGLVVTWTIVSAYTYIQICIIAE